MDNSRWIQVKCREIWQSFLEPLKYLGRYFFPAIQCKAQSEAAACCLKDELRTLRMEVGRRSTELSRWLAAVACDHRSIHPGMLRCVLAMRGLQTDLGLLAFMVCRYPDNEFAWCTLSNLLVPVLEEAAMELEELISEQWNGPTDGPQHPLLENFLSRFTEEISRLFLSCEDQVQFEVRMMELLLLCPCGNLEVGVCMTSNHSKKVNIYCELRNLPYFVGPPRVSEENSKEENQQELLSFLIHYIKRSTANCIKEYLNKTKLLGKSIDDLAFSPDFNEIISFVLSGDESSLEKVMTNENWEVFKIFSSTYSGNCVVTYSFEVDSIGSNLYTSNQFSLKSFKSIYSIPRGDQTPTCQMVKCMHPVKLHHFTIEIKGENKGPYITEKLTVQYKCDEDNYKLLREEYSLF